MMNVASSLAAAAPSSSRPPGSARTWRTGLVSVTAGTATQVALALMHVVAGALWFGVVRRSTTRWGG